MEKQYAHYLQVNDYHNLDMCCNHIREAYRDFGFGIYLVGSVLTKRDWRDVDVRYILDDVHWEQIRKQSRFLNVCISEWIKSRTGLPVDFQFQGQTEANEKHKGQRNAIGFRYSGNY